MNLFLKARLGGLWGERRSPQMDIIDFHSITFLVSNSKTAASYFVTRYGFEHYAFRNLDTKWKYSADHAVKCGNIIIIFSSGYESLLSDVLEETVSDEKINDRVSTITLVTEGTRTGFPRVYGDVYFDYVAADEISNFFANPDGMWQMFTEEELDPVNDLLPPTYLERIDHIVGNQPVGEMETVCDYMEKKFNMHRFWSVDENVIHTEYSALRSVVMASPNEKVLFPINEPAPGRGKSQIQEFLDYNGGAGVQHIALSTFDIITSVRALRARGVKFLATPDSYYTDLKERLSSSSVVIKENLDELQELGILVDFDDNGYLLQIFADSIDYRPTIFFEIIQRNNHRGFGAGNFKALFTAIEQEQAKRGNL
jgi:4-hydroxyphenylpyruvate dioxygenase